MNRTPIEEAAAHPSRLGVDEQDPVEDWLNSRRWRLDEQDPMEGWLNSSQWRLDE